MRHRRLEFDMPASADAVFDVFHYHAWRSRWDSLVHASRVVGGAPCPFVGAVTENGGGGWLRGLSMRTQFVSFDRPRVAAAKMLGRSFPFKEWAASMRHESLGDNSSRMVYTYRFIAGPAPARWLVEPLVQWLFDRETKRRFARMRIFLAAHREEVEEWQAGQITRNEAAP
jgi:Polyketide cyclase / dehydrase and lipid transport